MPRWIENPEQYGMRLVGLAHEVAPAGYSYSRNAVEHEGWYTDPWQHETCCGVVYQVSGKDGRARYIAGMADPFGNDAAYLCLELIEGEKRDSDWESDFGLRDAARAADSIAEQWAEDEREYQTAWAAGRDYADALESERETRRDTLELLRQNRESGGSKDLPAIHNAIRDAVRKAWHEICESRENRKSLANGDGSELMFYTGDKRLREAFCDGAELSEFPA